MKKENTLLTIDALINLALGLPLTFVPCRMAEFLGAPVPDKPFYASILGAILTGIGVALLVERFKDTLRLSGLGLGGAIAINICGAVTLAAWLIGGNLNLPARGHAFLWLVVVVVLATAALEALFYWKRRR
jgi:tetrahydromethanopterin S-methyltransferase subunit D